MAHRPPLDDILDYPIQRTLQDEDSIISALIDAAEKKKDTLLFDDFFQDGHFSDRHIRFLYRQLARHTHQFTRLQYLSFFENSITDLAVPYIIRMLKRYPNVTDLNLGINYIEYSGAKQLISYIKADRPKLELNLAQNPATEEKPSPKLKVKPAFLMHYLTVKTPLLPKVMHSPRLKPTPTSSAVFNKLLEKQEDYKL